MRRLFILSIFLSILSCTSETDSQYLRWVGDSKFNPENDDAEFKPCHSESHVKQYFNFGKGLQYEGEKKALVEHFTKNYKPVNSNQSGWVRIRFIVNCKGETGRFRVQGSDTNYKEQKFTSDITNQLLHLTKSLDGWELLFEREKPKDYYQYLVFKIDNGNLIEIMP